MTVAGQWVHMVGIAGAGMSGIAHILKEQGFKVTGSDIQSNSIINHLNSLGIEIFSSHASSHVEEGVDILVISSAIPNDNIEVITARQKNIPVVKRGEMLATLVNKQKGIAIAGAHGKTTTTSMLALILSEAGVEPTFIVGGEFQNTNINAKLGRSDYFVVEADESDASFLAISPYIGVITNIEDDHLDYYKSFNNIKNAFSQFLSGIHTDGLAVLYGDDECIREISAHLNKRVLYYGQDKKCHYYIDNWQPRGIGSSFNIFNQGQKIGEIELSVPGKHNALNALAAIIIALELGVNFIEIKKAIKKFQGTKRRMEIIGERAGIIIIDDYAHHPTEILATLKAVRSFHNGRIISVFQPHRYSRTKTLGKELGEAFVNADIALFTGVYSAGEEPIPGINGETVYKAAKEIGCEAIYMEDLLSLSHYLADNIRSNDLVITMGAGDIWKVGIELLNIVPENKNKAHS
ncbi:MAG: UDP-N-acetylmuramate--L-alanine ligase [Syntrophomonadaceae bacterium]|nr:UDP-N-acetylmuramate--L-alanine ligase [Syntrophomonadaceae bacterium]